MPGTDDLCEAVDALVTALKRRPEVKERLAHTDFRNSAMFAVYPGGAARYIKHIDNSLMTDGRRLTTILYLNKDWEPSHGGQLRIFEPTMQSTRIKADVEPLWNRLVLFWSTEEVPHEVLPSYRDRAAVSIWYTCARECLLTEETFKRLASSKLHVIGSSSRAECMEAAALRPEQRAVLRLLGEESLEEGGQRSEEIRERKAMLTAISHDFTGCEAHRRQRRRLNELFGWDERKERVRRDLETAQQEQQAFFSAMGLDVVPKGSLHAQTSAPVLTEAFCREAEAERRTSELAPEVHQAAQTSPTCAKAWEQTLPQEFEVVDLPLPMVFEAVD